MPGARDGRVEHRRLKQVVGGDEESLGLVNRLALVGVRRVQLEGMLLDILVRPCDPNIVVGLEVQDCIQPRDMLEVALGVFLDVLG